MLRFSFTFLFLRTCRSSFVFANNVFILYTTKFVKTIACHVYPLQSSLFKNCRCSLTFADNLSPFAEEKVKTVRKACQEKLARVESALTEMSVVSDTTKIQSRNETSLQPGFWSFENILHSLQFFMKSALISLSSYYFVVFYEGFAHRVLTSHNSLNSISFTFTIFIEKKYPLNVSSF